MRVALLHLQGLGTLKLLLQVYYDIHDICIKRGSVSLGAIGTGTFYGACTIHVTLYFGSYIYIIVFPFSAFSAAKAM